MEVFAIQKNIPMSAQKMREVVRQIQGLPALQAQAVLSVVPRKGARFAAKTLSSAIANAAFFKDEWNAAKVEQNVRDLESQIENTRNHKRRNGLTRKLEKYQAFLRSPHKLAPESLRVKAFVAGAATTLKRSQPKARGSAGPILKRRCHIKITLSDE
jgi:large subunit ribosomal protein L22